MLSIRYDKCPNCPNSKDKRAKQCKECRKSPIPLSQRACRKDQCECGKVKSIVSDQCLECFHKAGAAKRALRRMCKCGEVKSEKSPQCMKCHLKEVSPIKNGKIRCNLCENDLDQELFYKTKRSKRSVCIECCRKSSRRRNIMSKCIKYGLSSKRAEEIANLAGVVCKICSVEIKQFHIDHCHRTNKFRGLLCSNCNSGLGLFNDSIEKLRSAIKYLKNHIN